MNFVEIENFGKRALEQFPIVKRSAKRVYQLIGVATSKEKAVSEGNIVRVSPNDDYEYFYGYYDKSPWDITDRYMLCIKVKQAYKSVAPKENAVIGVIDTNENNIFIEIATTRSWNVQQGCMAQWLGPDFGSRILYNDFRDGKYCAVIYDFAKRTEEKTLPMPAYDVSKDGSFVLSLDFSRLHRLRPGYGYSNLPDLTKGELCPDKGCIWKVDISDNKVTELFKYTDFFYFETDSSMIGAEHKVNHLMLSPDGKRFMVLHRWFNKGRKHTRLVTVNVDKSEMYNLSDDVFVSHCYWKNDDEILSFLRKSKTGNHYYLLKDKSQDYKMCWSELNTDGHCSYSFDKQFIVTDTYPNRKRQASVYLCTEEDNCYKKIASVFEPFRYDNNCRCDLHPRWNYAGDKICIDSVHEGKRGLYVIQINKPDFVSQIESQPLISVIIPCYNATKTLKKTIKSLCQQTYKNFEVIIIDDGSQDEIDILVKEICNTSGLRIKFDKQNNNGVSSARNHGMRLAEGEYICFLDADDVYHCEFFEKTMRVCQRFDSDVVLTYQERDVDSLMNEQRDNSLLPQSVSVSRLMSEFMYNKEHIHFGGLLYKKKIIKNAKLLFSEGTQYGEDLEFAWRYLINCKKGVILKEKMYGYYNNPLSAVNTVKWEKTHLVDAMLRTEKYMKDSSCDFIAEFSEYMLPRTVWTTAKTFAKAKNKTLYKKFVSEYNADKYIKRLVRSSRNKMLKLSSLLFCINKYAFYKAIGIVYKNK